MLIDAALAEECPIPHEPGQWLRLRRLAWTELDSANKAQERAALGGLTVLPEGVLSEALKGAMAAAGGAGRKTYDRALVLRFGIVGWSYPVPVSPEAIDRLDDVTAGWAFREILRLSGAIETEEERKNGSSASTAGSTAAPMSSLSSPT